MIQTQVTPIVEGYGGWAFRMEIVPIESAYPGFGDIIVSFGKHTVFFYLINLISFFQMVVCIAMYAKK